MKKTLYLVIIISATFTHLLHAQNQTDFFKLTSQTPKNNQAFKEDDIQVIGIKYPTSETSSVKIYLDDKDVTSQAVVRNESVHFIQKSKLFEGKHTIIVKVNQHTTSWQFTTSSPPKIINLLPNRGILAKSTKLIIGAQFLDRVSGVNLSSIILKLNDKDITSFANISHDKISYSLPIKGWKI